jgi:hypothetical protein
VREKEILEELAKRILEEITKTTIYLKFQEINRYVTSPIPSEGHYGA